METYKVGVPNMTYAELWEYEINVISKRFYSKYKYPEEYYKKLKIISDYCKQNDIKLVFFTPPTHTDLQKRIKDFNLEEENRRFLNDVSGLGQFYNLDVESDFTRNRENFVDPYHAWTDSFVIQKIWR